MFLRPQSSLTSLQNLFFNEHNRIADAFHEGLKDKISDPVRLDEVVYQETRRVVVAELQHVTFTQWLPTVLGPQMLTQLGLDHEECVYKEKADTGILNEFAAAAFRWVQTAKLIKTK